MIRLFLRSVSVFVAILLGAAIAFACFAPEAWIHRARSYVPISVSLPAAPVACVDEKGPTLPSPAIVRYSEEYDTGITGADKILRAAMVGVINGATERSLVDVLTRAEAAEVTDLELLIDSSGGNIDNAFHMTAMLAETSISVHCLVGVEAQSSALVLLQGCDDRAVLPSSKLMEHRPFAFVSKPSAISAEVLKTLSEELFEARQIMAVILATRSLDTLGSARALSIDEINRRMAEGDWKMTTAEAVSFGFVDRIVSSIGEFQESIEGAPSL